jgi:hypothetical protein
VILFPGGNATPRLSWFKIQKKRKGALQYEVMDFQGCFDEDVDANFSIRNIVQNRTMVRNQHERLQAFIGERAILKAPNIVVRQFSRGNFCGSSWGGSVVVARHRTEPMSEYFLDVDMLDARHAADMFSTCLKGISHFNPQAVACVDGCMLSYDTAPAHIHRYTSKVFKSNDPVFMSGGSGVANLIGIPLLLRTSASYHEKGVIFVEKTGNTPNPMATLLKRDIISASTAPSATSTPPNSKQKNDSYERMTGFDINSFFSGPMGNVMLQSFQQMRPEHVVNNAPPYEPLAGFGCSPGIWGEGKIGDVCVVRADGWPLAPEHLEAVCEYVKQKVEPLLLSATAGIDTATQIPGYEDILNSINKTAFLEFFNEYKTSKATTNPTWRDLLDPYVKIDVSQQALADRYKTQNVAE